jgi:hypothetical protein
MGLLDPDKAQPDLVPGNGLPAKPSSVASTVGRSRGVCLWPKRFTLAVLVKCILW